jgi:hypothetical protein
MQTSVFLRFSYRLMSRYPSSFVGAIIMGIGCCAIAALSVFYGIYATHTIRNASRGISFILSLEPQDSASSLKTLRSHPLIDSLAIVSSDESRLYIEDIVGTSLDSIELNSSLPTVIGVFPSMKCSSSADFASITELCERLPLTDNIVRDMKSEQSFIEQRRHHNQISFLVSIVLGMLLVILVIIYTHGVGAKVAFDASMFFHSGATPLFASMPWILMICCGMVIGTIVGAAIVSGITLITDASAYYIMSDTVELSLLVSGLLWSTGFILVPLRLYFAALFASGSHADKE